MGPGGLELPQKCVIFATPKGCTVRASNPTAGPSDMFKLSMMTVILCSSASSMHPQPDPQSPAISPLPICGQGAGQQQGRRHMLPRHLQDQNISHIRRATGRD